jgi:hypothetical protein
MPAEKVLHAAGMYYRFNCRRYYHEVDVVYYA